MVFKGDFLSMDSDENLLNIFILLLMTSHLPLVNMTRFYLYILSFPALQIENVQFNITYFCKILLKGLICLKCAML